MDLIIVTEITLLNTVISIDYNPNINFSGWEEFYRRQIGIYARLVLVKSKGQKKKQRQRQKSKNKQSKTPLNEKLDSIFKK
jgi:hypothetical protein